MKKFLMGAVAAIAIAAPGMASAQSAYVDLGYQSADGNILGTDVEADGWTIGGATAWGGEGSFGMQLDGQVGTSEVDGGDETTAWNLGAHGFLRNENHLVGGFVNFGNVEDDADDFSFWTIGLEGQYYMNRTTLDGAISYSDGEDIDSELTAIDLGLTHFVTDNFSLGGNIGFGSIETTADDVDASTYGVNGEYLFNAMPISIFGGWQHAEVDDIDSDADVLSIGVRYNWGGSLIERNRSGASLTRGGGLGRYGGLL